MMGLENHGFGIIHSRTELREDGINHRYRGSNCGGHQKALQSIDW